MTININKPILKSPKKNKLSKSLMTKLSNKKPDSVSKKSDSDNFKKIKLSSSRSNKKGKNNLFIPTDLSMISKPKELTVHKSNTTPVSEVKPQDNENKPVSNEVKSDVKQNLNVEKKSKIMSNRRLSRRKKSSKNKTVSIDLNNNKTVKKEKDIIELIDKFEKMDVKDIKIFLKNKGIQSKNNTKSKLLPYLYLLTCVDDDINIIKS
jgi:hypothetical protein|tara:strand:+ start:254 stop:874 length:621 start_codon:yes stop_codon:yes gene_type:complete